MSAYACGPGQGSEPGSGWQFARAAARHNQVWLVTRRRFADEIDAALATDPDLRRNLHVVYLELPAPLLRLKRGSAGVYWYYLLWQRQLARVARALHADIGFDVAHHVTFASDWLPAGVVALPPTVPVVWGPVGGATYAPRPLRHWLGPGPRSLETVRELLTRSGRRCWGDGVARRADLVVVHNGDVARRFRGRAAVVVVEPNPTLTGAELDPVAARPRTPGTPRAVFVGRLVSWKGTRLALEAIGQLPLWSLDYFGAGPDERYLRRRIADLRIDDRVSLRGPVSRPDVLSAMQAADVLLLPSLHDSASWVTAEAVSLGTPVVCLDVGGPPLVMDGHGVAVPAHEPVVPAIVRALESALQIPRRRSTRWGEERLVPLLDTWYDRVQGATDAADRTTSA